MSNSNVIQRTLYTQKGMRKKVYKRIQNKLFEMGVLKDKIDEVIALISSGQMAVQDATLVEDIKNLKKFDKNIERLTKKCDRGSAQTTDQNSESQNGISFE